MPTSTCPLCQERVFVDASTELGETLSCDECEENLVLVGLDPLELDPEEPDDEELGDGFNLFDDDE